MYIVINHNPAEEFVKNYGSIAAVSELEDIPANPMYEAFSRRKQSEYHYTEHVTVYKRPVIRTPKTK